MCEEKLFFRFPVTTSDIPCYGLTFSGTVLLPNILEPEKDNFIIVVFFEIKPY